MLEKIENTASGLKGQIEREIKQYLTETVSVGGNFDYSQYKLTRRIALFENHVYPSGKFDSQGNYKYWFDIQTPRIDGEVKNIDFNSRDVKVYSPRKSDELPCIITNLKLAEWMRENGQAEEINSAIEEGAGWGNVLWKKVKKTYERVDLRNLYVINQTAECVDETPIIERHQMIQSDLRAMSRVWDNVKDAIEKCGTETYKATADGQAKDSTTPHYNVYERNGEFSVKDLKEVHGEKPADGDEDKFVFGKVIAVGTVATDGGVTIDYILFAKDMPGKSNSDIYEEYHRGRYKGRWFREGLYELLFDVQVRANEIGNQIAQGLAFAAKKIGRSKDKLIIQNVMTDMRNGDIIRSEDLQWLDMRMDGFDQLANEYNRLIQIANAIANSQEIIQGQQLNAGTPLGLGQLYDQNANKLFTFIRQKLAIPFAAIFDKSLIPQFVKEMQAEDVLRLTGDADMLKRLIELVVEDWYITNLVAIGPHTLDQAQALKQQKVEELTKRPQILMKGVGDLFKDFAPHAFVDITGEGLNLNADLQTLSSFAQLEADPVRRSAIVELMARKKGLDFASLPKSPPMPPPGMTPSPMQPMPQKQKAPAPTP
jgi:hypothetical protein